MRDFSFSGASTFGAALRAALDAEPRARRASRRARRSDRGDRALVARAPDPPAPADARRDDAARSGRQGVRARRRRRLRRDAPMAAFSAGRLVGLDGLLSLSWALDAVRALCPNPPRLPAGPRPTTTAPRSSSVIEQPTTTHNASLPDQSRRSCRTR